MSMKAVYTQQQQIQFIRRIFKKCKEISEQSGISLRFILAQAALEAYWGKSVKQNNLFGVKPDRYWKKNHLPTQKFWTKEEKNGVTKRTLGTFCAYKDEDDSIQGWLDFLRRNPRYKKLFDPTIRSDYEKVAGQIRLSAYATDSKYVFKLLGTIEGPTMRKALAGYSINEQIKHVAYKYKPAKPSPLPKSSTGKKQLNKSATNINQHPHAAKTGEAWHQNSHYNLKRWNIAPRFHSTFNHSSGKDFMRLDAADNFHRFCQRQLNEIEVMETEVELIAHHETENNETDATIKYAGNMTKIPMKAENVLTAICRDAGVKSVTITSTTRTASEQARIMYGNIVTYGASSQKRLYGAAGDRVIDEYVALKKAGKMPQEIKAGMEKKIIEIGPQKVSKHCADTTKISVFDVAPSSVPAAKKAKFEAAVSKHSDVTKFLYPPSDPAYHIEINL